MAIKTIDQNPTLIDTVKFIINAPGVSGNNPHQIISVAIDFIERDFVSNDNIYEYTLQQGSLNNTFYYNKAETVQQLGNSLNPAWLSTASVTDNILVNTENGVFELLWNPQGMREGQYFVCWTWQPGIGSDLSSNYLFFNLSSATSLNNIPQHQTKPNKYANLLDKYTPSFLKTTLVDGDVSPDIINKFNLSVADGFTTLEDLSNQIIDLLDANVINESLLPLLANFFNLKLKSQDPTLWRRQIKRAIPLFKKKGTLKGLKEAFDQAKISLKKLNLLWQVISPYTWQQTLMVTEDGQTSFTLDKTAIVDWYNFELSLRTTGDFISLTPANSYVSISGNTLTWLGSSLAVGDTLLVLYLVKDIPNNDEQIRENIIRSLPLNDNRDDLLTPYPLKNWNVRLISQDDENFNLIIPHPFPYSPPVVFGKIRTEFPFSENIYNMDSWNGSLRDSLEPCHIDKNFIDCCTDCLSSKYDVELEVDGLSDDRLEEINDILKEYTPFHAVLNTKYLSSKTEEYINCNIENIYCNIRHTTSEFIFSTGPNIFNRNMAMENNETILRNTLYDSTEVVASTSGSAASSNIVLVAPTTNLEALNINNQSYLLNPTSYTLDSNLNMLEILSPSLNAGLYTLSNINKHFANIDSGITEPLNANTFNFRISNIIYSNNNSNIERNDVYTFYDLSTSFIVEGIKTTKLNTVDAWKIKIGASYYTIYDLLPDDSVILTATQGTFPASLTGVSYSLVDASNTVIFSGINGALNVEKRAIVTVVGISDVQAVFKLDDYILYSGTQYKVTGFLTDPTQLYISYDGVDHNGITIQNLRRLVDNQVGYVDYVGLKLIATGDYEDSLEIVNGANATGYPWSGGGFLKYGEGSETFTAYPSGIGSEDDRFKENYLVKIGSYYYSIIDINGNLPPGSTTFTLLGEKSNYLTSGEGVNFSIDKLTKNAFTIPERDYPQQMSYTFETPIGGGPPTTGIDRRGKDIITTTVTSVGSLLNALAKPSGGKQEVVNQEESISFTITYNNGKTKEGTL